MASSSNRIAKLSRPRLHRAIARERLFTRLDEARDAGLVWVSGPPGSGKTTLLSTYVEHRGITCLWYQVEAADADLATFYYYLRMATQSLFAKRKSLPLFTPEFASDSAGFSRRFFRALFQEARAELSIVLDNYQELANDSPLHDALAAAIEEALDRSRFFVLSGVEAPATVARVRMNERMTELAWTDLRLTEVETLALVRDRHVKHEYQTQRLLDSTGGWIGGVTLLLE